MKTYKNITLDQVTVLLTIAFVVLNVLFLVTLYGLGYINATPWYLWLIILIVTIVLCFLTVKVFIQIFVFRKIKLIYKMINKSKKSLRSVDGIDNVTDDVVAWANKKDSEIEHLTELENYRRNFLGNISHELKTPIFSIQGYLLTLIEGGIYDKNINLKYLKRAVANTERLERIVEDLEMINKLESGKLGIEVMPFDIKLLTDEIFSDMAFMAEKKKITLSYKNGASKNYLVDADQNKIRQVFNNLIVNSIKYGKSGGTTKIAFYDIEEGILIEIGDNGIGIEDEHLNHLFDRFYRVDGGRGRKKGGSGLGLSIVKHIIEAHDQTITVRSTLGEGSTFSFTLKKSKR